jgi:hypothetical protein
VHCSLEEPLLATTYRKNLPATSRAACDAWRHTSRREHDEHKRTRRSVVDVSIVSVITQATFAIHVGAA